LKTIELILDSTQSHHLIMYIMVVRVRANYLCQMKPSSAGLHNFKQQNGHNKQINTFYCERHANIATCEQTDEMQIFTMNNKPPRNTNQKIKFMRNIKSAFLELFLPQHPFWLRLSSPEPPAIE